MHGTHMGTSMMVCIGLNGGEDNKIINFQMFSPMQHLVRIVYTSAHPAYNVAALLLVK